MFARNFAKIHKLYFLHLIDILNDIILFCLGFINLKAQLTISLSLLSRMNQIGHLRELNIWSSFTISNPRKLLKDRSPSTYGPEYSKMRQAKFEGIWSV